MADSHLSPTGKGPKDRYDSYRVEGIQPVSGPTEPKEEEDRPARNSSITAYAALVFKKLIDLFESPSPRGLSASAEDSLQEHLRSLKAILETLKFEDRSQDPPFLDQLARIWQRLLEDSRRFRRQTDLSSSLRVFLDEFHHYPERNEFSLGYYLTEHAGQKWIPFPYMEIILRSSWGTRRPA